MHSLFENHIDAMTAFCKGRRTDNQCLFGVDADGELYSDESPGANGGSLQGDWLAQIQFRGGSSRAEIEARVYSESFWLAKVEGR